MSAEAADSEGPSQLIEGTLGSWRKQTTRWPKLTSQDNHFGIISATLAGATLVTPSVAMSKVSGPPYEGMDDPPTQLREFAAECMELAQTTPSPEKRMMYLSEDLSSFVSSAKAISPEGW